MGCLVLVVCHLLQLAGPPPALIVTSETVTLASARHTSVLVPPRGTGAWSRRRQRFAFSVAGFVWTTARDGGDARRVARAPWGGSVAWDPTERFLLLTTGQETSTPPRLLIGRPTGGMLREIYRGARRRSADSQDSNEYLDTDVRPDGTILVLDGAEDDYSGDLGAPSRLTHLDRSGRLKSRRLS